MTKKKPFDFSGKGMILTKKKTIYCMFFIVATCILIIGLVNMNSRGCTHQWKEATCISAKICTICGVTEGVELGHDITEPTCQSPAKCTRCDYTEGLMLDHDFVNGNCIHCLEKDPNYTALKDYGFSNNNGMITWLKIDGYDLSNNSVCVGGQDTVYLRLTTFYSNYWSEGLLDIADISSDYSMNTELLKHWKTQPCQRLSNDVIQYNGQTGWGPISIIERVVVGEKLVIKTLDETGFRDWEHWYVPADMIDFSTIRKENDEYYVSFK